MSCSRIFLVALCLCTPLALAQDDSLVTGKAANNVQQVPDGRIPPAAPPSEPWRILPKPDIDVQEVPDLRIPAAAHHLSRGGSFPNQIGTKVES